MAREIVILAYSGGLDTSCILKWLIEKGYDVVCYMANIGQDDDFQAAKQKAMKIGAKDVVIEDRCREFVENYMLESIRMGLIYESRYLMGTSLARPCIAEGLVETAKIMNAKYISHGGTGKGNDQVRLELSAYALWPEGKVIAPWREREFFARFAGRQDLIKYAHENNIPVSASPKEPWSSDANMMHISYESGILENPGNPAPPELYQMTKDPLKAPDTPAEITIEFIRGMPVSVITKGDNKKIVGSMEIVELLNKIGSIHGVGRIDVVENRFIGLKSRGVYECPAGTILHIAHLDLEIYCIDREVLRLKKILQDKMSDLVYNGFWFSPEAYFAKHCLQYVEEAVTGKVNVRLYKGSAIALSRESQIALYSQKLASMDEHGGLSPDHASGFINIHAIRLKQYANYCERKKMALAQRKSIFE